METALAADGGGESSTALQALERASRYHDVCIEGCKVRWRRWGTGEPLVLFHGGHGNWAHWLRNIGHLATQHEVWVPDMPGFGDSDELPASPDETQGLDRLVRVLSLSLDALLGRDAAINLAGFSFGGLVAGTVAAQRQGVTRLALLGTAGHGGPRRQAPALVKWRLADRCARLRALRHNLGELMLHHPQSIDDTAMAIHEQATRATRFRSKGLSLNRDLKVTLEGFSRPVLLVWGEHDVVAVPDQAAARLMGGHPERQFHLVPDVGHWVQYEAADEVNRVLSRWLQS